MTKKKEPLIDTEILITIGEHTLCFSRNGILLIYGPDGEEMQLGKKTEATLAKVLAKFFKENM